MAVGARTRRSGCLSDCQLTLLRRPELVFLRAPGRALLAQDQGASRRCITRQLLPGRELADEAGAVRWMVAASRLACAAL
jgi:hypothetical protein